MGENALTNRVIGAAIEVHKYLGPGLMESAYHACLMRELKTVASLGDLYQTQLLTYLRLTKRKLGLLINFNELLLKHSIQRVVNRL